MSPDLYRRHPENRNGHRGCSCRAPPGLSQLRFVRWAAASALAFSLGCSLNAQLRRDTRLREGLDQHRFRQSLALVWPAAMRLVTEHHFQLVGRDRVAVGEAEQSAWKRLTGGGFQTRRFGDHGFVLETRENAPRVRYRIEGVDTGNGTCRVTFTAVRRTSEAPSEEKSRDLDMEVELVRRLDPGEAARIIQAADAVKD